MRRGLVVLLVVAACGQRAPAPTTRVVPSDPPLDKRDRTVDRGELEIRFDDKPVGRERFTIEQVADGYRVRSETQLHYAGKGRLFDSDLSTDAAWRPRRGKFRSVDDGGTVSTLEGDLLALTTVITGRAPRIVTAPAPVDVFIADNAMIHFTATCVLRPGSYIGFPGERLWIGGDVKLPSPTAPRRSAAPPDHRTEAPASPSLAIVRRDVDRGGAIKASVYCQGDRLIAVDMPMAALTAIREGHQRDFAALRRRDRPKPVTPLGLVEEDRTVVVRGKGVDDAELACTLLLPSRDRRVRLPAVIMISGTGPQDRDEDTVGPGGVKLSFFKVLAIALGRAGIASLRCDDRGTGDSSGRFHEASLTTFVADARAMLATLRREPAIDPARIGLVGHSEGGVIAPLIAVRDPKVRALALLAAPGRPLDVVLLDQMARGQRRAGTAPEEAAAALARYRAAFAAVAAGKPLPDTVEARDWKGTEIWLRSVLPHDPAATAARLRRVPVLIAQGAKDQQVSAVDAEALLAAFERGRNRRVTFRLYPNLNHLFAPSATGDISEYADPDIEVDGRFVADLVAFLSGL